MQQRIFNALPCLSIIKFLNSLSDKRKGDAAPPVIFVCKMTFVHYAEMFCEYLWNKQITISETFVRYVWNISGTFEPHVDFYIYLMFTSFFYIHVMATSFFYIYVMATSFFFICVMTTSFLFIYVMATSLLFVYYYISYYPVGRTPKVTSGKGSNNDFLFVDFVGFGCQLIYLYLLLRYAFYLWM